MLLLLQQYGREQLTKFFKEFQAFGVMIITGKTDTEHLEHLEAALQRLYQHGLRVNAEKCEFFKDQINLCGRIIDRGELHKTPDTVDGILNAPRPLGFEHVLSIVFEDGSE